MLKIGLTGGIGSGKTAVSDAFEKLGINIIDTDIISHQLIDNNKNILKKIVDNFGENILDNHCHLDRKKLAKIVFNDKKKKQLLENILHPRIREETNKLLDNFNSGKKSENYIIIVIPLLFETGFNDLIDRTLVVLADETLRVERIKQRDNRNMGEIRCIINSQVDDETRRDKADDIIENNNNFNQLESRVKQLHNQYIQLSKTI